MKNKLYELKNNGLTILLKSGSDKGDLKFEGLIVDYKPHIVYKDYLWTSENKNDKTYMKITDYLYNKLKDEADIQLQEYINNNISNMNFYYKKDEYNQYTFWSRINSFFDKYPEIDNYINIDLSDVVEGIVNCNVNNAYCIFDFTKDEFIEIKHKYNEQKKVIPLDIFYGKHLDLILAIEQYNKGIAHKTFTEVINLNKFLKDKKSIKIQLKNGCIIKYKNWFKVEAGHIIEVYNGEFYITNNYDMTPRPKKPIPITELDYLMFGRKKYKVNINNLVLE